MAEACITASDEDVSADWSVDVGVADEAVEEFVDDDSSDAVHYTAPDTHFHHDWLRERLQPSECILIGDKIG